MTEISKDYLDVQIQWLDKYFHSKIESINNAVNKAESALHEWKLTQNEFRDTLKDQAAQFATKAELQYRIDGLSDRIAKLELSKATGDGRSAVISSMVAICVSLITALIVGYFT